MVFLIVFNQILFSWVSLFIFVSVCISTVKQIPLEAIFAYENWCLPSFSYVKTLCKTTEKPAFEFVEMIISDFQNATDNTDSFKEEETW